MDLGGPITVASARQGHVGRFGIETIPSARQAIDQHADQARQEDVGDDRPGADAMRKIESCRIVSWARKGKHLAVLTFQIEVGRSRIGAR